MHSILKRSLAAVVAAGFSTSFAVADESQLSGELKITSDMSNPAPRAVMESLAAGFGELHPDVDIELTIVDREAWKTQIRNALGGTRPMWSTGMPRTAWALMSLPGCSKTSLICTPTAICPGLSLSKVR